MTVKFGTDGVRGEANVELTPEMAFQLGRAGAFALTKECRHAPMVLVGMDTRLSGGMLEAAISAGLCSVGANVLNAGVLPTPGVARLVQMYRCDAGIVISASHNKFSDNGIKFFNGEGYKLRDELEREIEGLVADGCAAVPLARGAEVGRLETAQTAVEDYVRSIEAAVPIGLEGMSLALDCANGATYRAAPLLFRMLGANVTVIGDKPDGRNINDGCGSTHMGRLTELVRRGGFNAGFAFDGDGDRLIAADENGEELDGDQVLSICGCYMKERGELAKGTIVATVMSNLGLMLMAGREGISIERTGVGDRYVLERMLEGGYNLGGEQSGHIIFADHATTGDGLLTAAMLAAIMRGTGKRLSQLNTRMERLPQVLLNAAVPHHLKARVAEDGRVLAEIRRVEALLGGKGRVLLRPSGTEAVVRVMIEGQDEQEIAAEARTIKALLEEITKEA